MRSGLQTFVTVLAIVAGASSALADGLATRSAKGSFDDVKFDVSNVLVERGLKVSAEGNVAAMLERTGSDVGATGAALYKGAHYFTFCSAVHSRRMMEADPALVGVCPFVVFVYETTAKPGEVVVGHRSLKGVATTAAGKAVLDEIDVWLDGIVADATK
ncbi:MAG TPA: DUF302 domain-containing protein [Hyphomicrobiaceae bacterium]|nr:DUF302 domain-containing protein [Hyphomicrobiaceae bacterium]